MTQTVNKISSLIISFIKLLTVAVIATTVTVLIGKKYFDNVEQSYLQEMKKFKQQADSAVKFTDSLKKQIVVYEEHAKKEKKRADDAQKDAQSSIIKTGRLQKSLDSLKKTVTDSVEMARIIIPKQDSIITEQSIIIDKNTITIESLNKTIIYKDTTIKLLTISRDSLQNVINNIPTPPKPPKITRKQMFIAGVITGVFVKTIVF